MVRSSVALAALLMFPSMVLAQTGSTIQVQGGGVGGVTGGVVEFAGVPQRDTQPPATGTSVIRGRIIDASNGTPLRKASVRISSPEIREMRSATTDVEGRYEFRDLPGGRFNVSAGKAGYVDLSYGQSAPFEASKPLQLGEKQTVEKVDLALSRGAVITGRVLDEYGEPIADVQVMPMRNQFTPAGRRPTPSGRSATTNDIGEFRLFGLAPGQYFISATYRNMGFNGGSDDQVGYAPTYYPGTANIADAQSLPIGLGGSVSDVTLMLVSTRTARITGTAIDSQGRPVRQGAVMVMPRGGMMQMSTAGGPIRPDGTFTINGVPPGEYMLRAMLPGIPGPGALPEAMTATVSVNGVDVTDVRLEPLRPITVTGRVVLDPVAARSFKPETFRLGATPSEPMMLAGPPPPPSAVRDDLTFEFKTYPGNVIVRPMAAATGWMVKAVYLNGADVTDGITLRDEDVSGLEVELTNRVPDVSGLVTNGKGEIVKEYAAIAFPQDQDRWNAPGPGRNAMVRPDEEGRFRFRTLRPGDYYVAAIEHVQNGDWMDPVFLESIRMRATRISVNEGDTQTLDLKLIQGR
jgi:protocatechuate 3,4-dioxygenase beta subunit